MANIKPRNCKICGKEFIPNSCRQYYCKDLHYRQCPICGKSYPEKNLDKFKFPPTTCSMECRVKLREQTSLQKYGIKTPGNNPEAREKSKQTMMLRYGVEYAQEAKEIKEKSKDTWMRRYGVDNPQKYLKIKQQTKQTNTARYGSTSYLNSAEGKANIDKIMLDKYGTTVPLRNSQIRQQCKQTNMQKYGVENPASNEGVRNKMKQTSLERYGVEYPASSELVKQRVKDTFIRNYGVDNCFKSEKIINKIRQSFFDRYKVHSVMEVESIANKIRETTMKKYGVPYYVMLPNVARSSGRISKLNQEISNKLTAAGIYNKLEISIEHQSFDIGIPQGNLLIEIDPTYTHSTAGNHWNPTGLDKYYHLKKTILAEEHGYRCIHIWDWDCISKFIKLLTNKNTVYTQSSPEIIPGEEAKRFIEQYSLYDITESVDHILFVGLRYKTKLMLLMGFKLTEPTTNTWTILNIDQRFNYTVYDGYNTVLGHFVNLCHPDKIVAYADYSKSNGELLENLGFEYNRFMLPNKIWAKGRHAIVDSDSIIPDAMLADGWSPVYNCGYKVYEKTFGN